MSGEEEIVESNIESGPAPNWVSEMKEKIEGFLPSPSTIASESWRRKSIYQIPRSMKRRRGRGAYEPVAVSIGPYHHGEEHLHSMEEHKRRALARFLGKFGRSHEVCVEAVAAVAEDLKDAYNQLDRVWEQDDEAFVRLMVVDGCFVLEVMRAATGAERLGYARNDPVFGRNSEELREIKRDMLLLENQIPLLALVTLLRVEAYGFPQQDQLSSLILEFLHPSDYHFRDIEEYSKCLHILDLYRRSLLFRHPREKQPEKRFLPRREKPGPKIRPATELAEAGIRLRTSPTPSLNDVSFRGRVLRLPRIAVDDALEPRLLNAVAFERLQGATEVASFVHLMGSIIRGARDAELLRSRGIIEIDDALVAGGDGGVAKMFESLSVDISMDRGGALASVEDRVAAHCERLLPRCRVCCSRGYGYARANWVSLSVFGAVSLFVLTAVQAFYAVLAYYHPKR